jgi:hypothetical protein
LIFFEPVTWDDLGVGFQEVPGGPEFSNRTVLSYHFYIPPDISLEGSFQARMNVEFIDYSKLTFRTWKDLDVQVS